MTTHDISAQELVRNLRRVGLRPSDRTIDAILERGSDAVAPLAELALATDTLMEEEPTSLGPVHALRLLGELKPSEVAGPLLRKLPLPVETEQPTQGAYLWSQEVPQIVANLGAEVLPVILEIANDMDAPALQRGSACATLGFLATTTPALRDEIAAVLRERLGAEPDSTTRGYIVATLAQLQVREAYSEVMDAYKNQRVDRSVMSAADARQLLLGAQNQRQLECALHTLAERYEQHGPYSEEQQRAMAEAAQRNR